MGTLLLINDLRKGIDKFTDKPLPNLGKLGLPLQMWSQISMSNIGITHNLNTASSLPVGRLRIQHHLFASGYSRLDKGLKAARTIFALGLFW